MSHDQVKQEAEVPAEATGSKRALTWRAELTDNYCKLRKLELSLWPLATTASLNSRPSP